MRVARMLRAGFLVGATWIACAPPPPGPPITVGGAALVASAANEPHATYATGGGQRPQIVAGILDRRPIITVPPKGFNAWSRSDAPPSPLVFVECNVDDASCASTLPKIPSYAQGKGDPGVAADHRGHVVMVHLAHVGDPNAPESTWINKGALVAYVSYSNGRIFEKVARVNATGTCSGGRQDMPHVAVDLTTEPPTFWFVWRHRGAGSFGACIRRARIVDDPMMPPDPSKAPLDFLGEDAHVVQNVRGAPFSGLAAVMVQAGDGAVTVVEQFNGNPRECPNEGLNYEGWGSVTSYDDGVTWTANASIHETQQFAPCVFAKQHQKNMRDFGYVRSFGNGHDYAAVNDSRGTIRVFHSKSQGWSWREIFQATLTGPADPKRSVLYPTLGVDGNGRLGLFYYESNPAGGVDAVDTKSRPVFCATTEPEAPTPQNWTCQAVTGFSVVPMKSSKTGIDSFRAWGDYAGMAVVGPLEPGCNSNGTFFPFWCQASTPTDTNTPPDVFAAPVTVGP